MSGEKVMHNSGSGSGSDIESPQPQTTTKTTTTTTPSTQAVDAELSKDAKDRIERGIRFHDNTIFKETNVYKHLVGERPRRKLESFFGGYYTLLHTFFVVTCGYLILFDNSLSHLLIGLFIISLDGYANVVLHDCPLSMLENKYIEKSGIDTRLEFLRSLGIMYSAENKFDIQLEVIINGWSLLAGKILFLICFQNFTSRSFV